MLSESEIRRLRVTYINQISEYEANIIHNKSMVKVIEFIIGTE